MRSDQLFVTSFSKDGAGKRQLREKKKKVYVSTLCGKSKKKQNIMHIYSNSKLPCTSVTESVASDWMINS